MLKKIFKKKTVTAKAATKKRQPHVTKAPFGLPTEQPQVEVSNPTDEPVPVIEDSMPEQAAPEVATETVAKKHWWS